jgi:hypothetical protein
MFTYTSLVKNLHSPIQLYNSYAQKLDKQDQSTQFALMAHTRKFGSNFERVFMIVTYIGNLTHVHMYVHTTSTANAACESKFQNFNPFTVSTVFFFVANLLLQ